jgi:stage V sporulation protein G
MNITDVRVFPVDEDKLKAYVTITLDHCFVIRDLKVIHGATGLFIAMPAKRRKDGTYKDIAHPLNADTRLQMERAILDEYARHTGTRPQLATGGGHGSGLEGGAALEVAAGLAAAAYLAQAPETD